MLGLPRQVYMHPEDAVEFTPLEVPGLVGWWDFTDTSTMTVAVNGSGSAPTNGQAIGNIKNKSLIRNDSSTKIIRTKTINGIFGIISAMRTLI